MTDQCQTIIIEADRNGELTTDSPRAQCVLTAGHSGPHDQEEPYGTRPGEEGYELLMGNSLPMDLPDVSGQPLAGRCECGQKLGH